MLSFLFVAFETANSIPQLGGALFHFLPMPSLADQRQARQYPQVVDCSDRKFLSCSSSHPIIYAIEFDANARYRDLRIDFDAMGEHLYQLDRAAKARGVRLALVIFDTAYLPRLFATPHGAYLRDLPFMKGKPWVRHDEHYHVDFAVPCLPALR